MLDRHYGFKDFIINDIKCRMGRDTEESKRSPKIQQQLGAGQFDFSRHAFKRAVERNISEQEIRTAGARAEVFEEYPEDKYSPICVWMSRISLSQRRYLRASCWISMRRIRVGVEILHLSKRTPSVETGKLVFETVPGVAAR